MSSITHFALAVQHECRLKSRAFLSLLNKYRSIGHNLSAQESIDLLTQSTEGKALISDDAFSFADEVVQKSERLGVEIIVSGDESYPKILHALKEPPPILHFRGNRLLLSSLPGIAVVGTRNATKNGEIIAHRISKFLAESGWVVISGLALGIDAQAHSGAIEGAEDSTIAVLAHGLDRASPKKNEGLAHKILDSGGAWVSEHPVGTSPRRHFFVPRNRIQVGLSSGSIIVEAELKSGSISQANFCREINRPLFVVTPIDLQNSLGLRSSGTIMLAEDRGAIPIKSKADYLALLSVIDKSKTTLLSRWSR